MAVIGEGLRSEAARIVVAPQIAETAQPVVEAQKPGAEAAGKPRGLKKIIEIFNRRGNTDGEQASSKVKFRSSVNALVEAKQAQRHADLTGGTLMRQRGRQPQPATR